MGGGGGGTKQDFDASGQFANIAREQWTDWNARFHPYQDKLIQTLQSQPDLRTAIVGARTDSARAFDAASGEQSRDLARMGVAMTDAQRTAVDRQSSLARAGLQVGLENSARQHLLDRDLSVMGGGLAQVRNEMNKGAH